MSKRIINKSVSFNDNDPIQAELLRHVIKRSTNFSAYMKRLIQRDIDGVVKKNVEVFDQAETHIESEFASDLI